MQLNYMAVMRLHNMARQASTKDEAQFVAQVSVMRRVGSCAPAGCSPAMQRQPGSHRAAWQPPLQIDSIHE